MKFTKMHGLGNDYLYIYAPSLPDHADVLSVRLSDRHFGAGSDGMIWILPSDIADWKMRIFNADGSEAKMCGNGIRCVGKYLYDKGYTQKTSLSIETLSGVRRLTLFPENGRVNRVAVDMGTLSVCPEESLFIDGREVRLHRISVGNPHAVIFTGSEAETDFLLTVLGPKIERHPAFPGGVNVEFVTITGPNALRMRVWERGSGVTMACGTGACASAAAAVFSGRVDITFPIAVELDGGRLEIRLSPDLSCLMTGPAETVYEGEIPETDLE